MAITVLTISALTSILAGLIVIMWKKSLNYVVGGWLILNGLLALLA